MRVEELGQTLPRSGVPLGFTPARIQAQQPVHLCAILVGAFKVTDTNRGPWGKDVSRNTNGARVGKGLHGLL